MENVKSVLLRLAPWIVISIAGAVAFGSFGLAAGLALLALAEVLQFLRDHAAIDGANRMALARRTSEAEAMAARLNEIEKQLKEALLPERMQLARDMMKNKLRETLGRGV